MTESSINNFLNCFTKIKCITECPVNQMWTCHTYKCICRLLSAWVLSCGCAVKTSLGTCIQV